MRLLIFNPENDLALASNDPHYTPPASARQMAADLQDLPRLWAEEGDVRLTLGGPSGPSPCPSPVREGRKVTSDNPESPLPNRGGAGGGAASSSLLPWGWSPLLVRQLRDRGVPNALLPTDEQMTEYRNFASRETVVRLLKLLRAQWPEPFRSGALVGESIWCTSEEQVLCAINDYGGAAMLKAPWSGSGRGLFKCIVQSAEVHSDTFVNAKGEMNNEKSESQQSLCTMHSSTMHFKDTMHSNTMHLKNWIRRTLKTQGGVEVEPLYNKVQDLAMEFWAEGGRVRYEGLSLFQTTAGGVYAGNLVAAEKEKEARLATYLSPTLLQNVRLHLTDLLNEAGLPAWYTGPLGIDMMIVVAHPRPLPKGGESQSSSIQQKGTPLLLGGDGGGLLTLHPLLELNLRMTMGWVALQLTSQLQDGETGTFCIECQDGHYQALVKKHALVSNPYADHSRLIPGA